MDRSRDRAHRVSLVTMAYDDYDAVIDALADGMSVAKVSRQYGLPQTDVKRMLKEATELCYNGEAMREAWALEVRRLQAVGLKFFHKAMADGNPADAMVFIKASERRATLAGANMPQAHIVRVANEPPRLNSTQHISNVLDNILGISARERELEDKDLAREPITDDERGELKQFRDARKAKQLERLMKE